MRDIVYELDSTAFARIRIGFRSESDAPLISQVLSAIPSEDRPLFERSVEQAAEAALAFAQGEPWDAVMRRFQREGITAFRASGYVERTFKTAGTGQSVYGDCRRCPPGNSLGGF